MWAVSMEWLNTVVGGHSNGGGGSSGTRAWHNETEKE